MSKQEEHNVVEDIKNVFDEYRTLVSFNENIDNAKLIALEVKSEKVLQNVKILRKFLLITYTILVVIIMGSLFALYKLDIAYDKIYDLKLDQSETRFDSINKVITGLKFIENQKVKDTNVVSYYSRNDGTIITYQDVNNERDTLFKKNQILKNNYNDVKSQLDLIKKHYPIKTTVEKVTKNNTESVIYSVESKKIDEALYFYDKYKNKIEDLEGSPN